MTEIINDNLFGIHIAHLIALYKDIIFEDFLLTEQCSERMIQRPIPALFTLYQVFHDSGSLCWRFLRFQTWLDARDWLGRMPGAAIALKIEDGDVMWTSQLVSQSLTTLSNVM